MKSEFIGSIRLLVVFSALTLLTSTGCQNHQSIPTINSWFGATTGHQVSSRPLPPSSWKNEDATPVSLSANPSDSDSSSDDELHAPIPSLQSELPDY